MRAVTMEKILIVEDNKGELDMLETTLKAAKYEVVGVRSGEVALKRAARESFDLALVDVRLPKLDGIEVLRRLRELDPLLLVVMMTGYGTVETAVEAMRKGAYDFLTKPLDTDHLLVLVQRALRERNVYRENILLKDELRAKLGLPEIIGKSRAMEEVASLAQRVARSDSTVLLLGESGTGKELFARAIHSMSPRKERPFVAINCAAIPRELLENELFGSEKGAFTGAVARKIGKFELASTGSVFLDEVADLDLSLQAKILRVLQERRFERLGGTKEIVVDVRVIAASNKDLKAEMLRGSFREDLFYRLSVFPISLPPLRDRREDIPLLVEHVVDRYCGELKKAKKTLSKESLGLLLSYSWPGNVRELENILERAIILTDEPVIPPENIWVAPKEEDIPEGSLKDASDWGRRKAETKLITKALEAVKGNKSKAARILKVSYKTLLTKIKEYGIE